MNIAYVSELYGYNRWANQQTLSAASALSAEMFTRTLGGSFGSVRGTLGHIYGAEWIWLERWHGRSPTKLPQPDFPDIGSLEKKWAMVEHARDEYLRTLTEAALHSPMAYTNLQGQRFAYPLWQQLAHVVNHSSYHRGQITTLLRQLGAQPASTDLLRYYDAKQAGAAKT